MSSEGFTENEVDAMPDRIAETFSGLNVFITGGTGFMGKVLIEKLLRKCHDIGKIFLLMRAKRGKNPRERLEEMLDNEKLINDERRMLAEDRSLCKTLGKANVSSGLLKGLFAKVRELRGGVAPLLVKLHIVTGDVIEPDLGISEKDRNMLIEEVNVIVHAAATIRFDEELRKAVFLNVRGTKLMLELAKECKHLQIFFYISTAYCHLHEKLLEEKPYPPPANPHNIIKVAEWMDEETIALLTPKLLNKIPNSYAFTKALAEALAVEAMQHIPVVVLRPSIVIPIWLDPVPGWTDNINGPTGLLIGAGKGVIRTMYCQGNSYADYLPVDVFINGIMITAWNYIKYGDKTSNVINFTTSAEIKVTWTELIDAGKGIAVDRIPLNNVLWYPGGSMKHSRLHHNICAFFFHWVPAFIIDTLLYCLGYEPVLMRVQRRIRKGFDVFEYYTNNQWDFKSDLAQTIRQRLNTRERRDYKIDAIGVDIMEYFENCIRAARRFILKESDDTIPAARRHMKIMWFVDLVVRYLFWALILYWLSGCLSSLYTFVVGNKETPAIVATSI